MRIPSWCRPALTVAVATPIAAAIAWAVTAWQIERDENCRDGATHASCGLSAADAVAFVLVVSAIALGAALVAGWRTRPAGTRIGWVVAAIWAAVVTLYVALPPSG